ncbi:sensor histidine kinase [Shinella kummerowiae]|jgi:two-component system sensor histidine kinase KdpD
MVVSCRYDGFSSRPCQDTEAGGFIPPLLQKKRQRPCDKQEVIISVTDLGKSIPPAEIDRVFEKFYRRGKPEGRSSGPGLGLSTARGFIDAMGGRFHAESPAVKKCGTRIVVRMPALENARAGKTAP